MIYIKDEFKKRLIIAQKNGCVLAGKLLEGIKEGNISASGINLLSSVVRINTMQYIKEVRIRCVDSLDQIKDFDAKNISWLPKETHVISFREFAAKLTCCDSATPEELAMFENYVSYDEVMHVHVDSGDKAFESIRNPDNWSTKVCCYPGINYPWTSMTQRSMAFLKHCCDVSVVTVRNNEKKILAAGLLFQNTCCRESSEFNKSCLYVTRSNSFAAHHYLRTHTEHDISHPGGNLHAIKLKPDLTWGSGAVLANLPLTSLGLMADTLVLADSQEPDILWLQTQSFISKRLCPICGKQMKTSLYLCPECSRGRMANTIFGPVYKGSVKKVKPVGNVPTFLLEEDGTLKPYAKIHIFLETLR